MTLADVLCYANEKELVEEVLLHIQIETHDSRAKAIARGVRSIMKTAKEGSTSGGKNDYILIGYKGFRECLPSVFVDVVAKADLVAFRSIKEWDEILTEWFPDNNAVGKIDLQRLPFDRCIDLITRGVDLEVMPVPFSEDSFPAILPGEICPSTDNYITHITPAVIIGRVLAQAGLAYPDYGIECDLLNSKWDIRALGTKRELLLRLTHHPSFFRSQLEIRDDLFNYISYYSALKNCMRYLEK